MSTLNVLGYRIAEAVGKPNDHVTVERAKLAFKSTFAERIRQSVEKNGLDETLLLTIKIPIVISDTNYTNLSSYRTLIKVPKPMRIKNDAPFTTVSLVEDNIVENNSIAYRLPLEIPFMNKNKDCGFTKAYTYFSNTIVVFLKNVFKNMTFNKNYTHISLTTIFENPEEVISYFTSDDTNDIELPYPEDMIESIILEILKTEFNLNTPTLETK